MSETENKRKTFTSTQVKARYNKKTYKNYNVNLRVIEDDEIIKIYGNHMFKYDIINLDDGSDIQCGGQ